MLRTFTAGLAASLVLASTAVFSQSIGEYSRAIGTVTSKKGTTVPGSGKSIAPSGKNAKSIVQGVGGTEIRSIPSSVTVRFKEASLYARSDELSDKKPLAMGDKLTPMREAVGVNALWYMVKTEAGMVGWVKSSDVETDSSVKP